MPPQMLSIGSLEEALQTQVNGAQAATSMPVEHVLKQVAGMSRSACVVLRCHLFSIWVAVPCKFPVLHDQ